MSTVVGEPTVRGNVRYEEPMARHCSWRAGGAAGRWFEPADLADLRAFLEQLPPDEPILWTGLGSNLLVRDGGFPGTIICTAGILDDWRYLDDVTLRVEAGVTCAKVARINAEHGYTGTEFLAGIPGTMGGALAMNAGAWGGETWDLVTGIETVDRSGRLHVRKPADFDIGYRSVSAPGEEWFVAAELRLIRDTAGKGRERIRELLASRQRTQPLGEPSCGSVFRNPDGDYAGRLIEAAGLKGHRIGGASVSTKHANFIVNDGSATAADIESLLEHVRATVLSRHGVSLQSEVRIVGRPRGAQA